MKLLKKQSVNTQAAVQRKMQVDEGVKIAQKVDTLRQTLGNLQQQHDTFVNGMKAELERTTQGLSDGIENKKRELKELEVERQKLVAPLDREWQQINERSQQLTDYAQGLNNRHLILKQNESEFILKSEELDLEEKRITERKTQSIQSLAKAEANREETQRVLLEMHKAMQEASEDIEERYAELSKRQLSIEDKEKQLVTREDNLAKELQGVELQKKKIVSDRATLLAAKELLEKKHVKHTKRSK